MGKPWYFMYYFLDVRAFVVDPVVVVLTTIGVIVDAVDAVVAATVVVVDVVAAVVVDVVADMHCSSLPLTSFFVRRKRIYNLTFLHLDMTQQKCN